jgi:O-antigen ligase
MGSSRRSRPVDQTPNLNWKPAHLLVAFLGLVFLTGGGSRAEISSLMILRPAAALVLCAGLITLTYSHAVRFRTLSFLALGTVALCALHLVPLPPELWQRLPGREIIVEIDSLAGINGSWRPLTMDPVGGFNALWSLLVPLAVFVLAVQLDQHGIRLTLTIVLILGLLSAIVAVLQVVGGPQSPLYLYRVSSPGLPVGLFANRNHQAVLLACLVPLGAAWLCSFDRKADADIVTPRTLLFVFGGVAAFIMIIVLLTGSRAGLASLALALPAAAWVAGLFDPKPDHERGARPAKNFRRAVIAGAALLPIAGLLVLAMGLDRGLAIERLLGNSPADDLRALIVPTTLGLAGKYAPFGSGLGSFEAVFKLHESDHFLGPAYVNHAHNDFVEVAMTLGIPGVLLMLIAALSLALTARSCFSKEVGRDRSRAMSRAALAVLFLLAFASLWDYPLRVPSMQSIGVLAAVWLSGGGSTAGIRRGRGRIPEDKGV